MIKLKSIIVILFSSLVISAALVITIIGSSLHLSWREKEAAKLHSRKISGLNAKLYGQHINIFDLQAKRGRISIYKEKFLIEGIIKNTQLNYLKGGFLKRCPPGYPHRNF